MRNIASPTLVTHGTEDRYVPVANAAALAEAIPDATLRVIDDAGRLVFIEQADEVNNEIISFLEPFEREPSWRLSARQKAKRLMQRTGEANERPCSPLNLASRMRPRTRARRRQPKKRRQRNRNTTPSQRSKDDSGGR